MRRIISALFLMTAATPALALDASEPEAQNSGVHDWTGAYVGVVGSWVQNRVTATDVEGEEYGGSTNGAQMSLRDASFSGGVTAGYNFQRGNWVYGPELELGWASNDKTFVENRDDGLYTKTGLVGSIVGRVGYASNRTLFYAKGGVAFSDLRNAGGEFDGVGNEDSDGKWGFDGNEAGFIDKTLYGWTVGLGVEHVLSDKWTVKSEYTFADFGDKRAYDLEGQNDEPFDFKNKQHSIKVGLNYRF